MGLAGTVGASAGGNISAQKLTAEGMSLTLSSAEKGLAAQLEGTFSSQVLADLREFVADSYFMRNGFTRLEGKCGANCFDGVYLKDGKVYINATKPLGTNNSISLSPADPKTGLPAQMSDSWIDSAVRRLATSADPAARKTATIIQDAIDKGTIIKLVTGVNSKGATVIKIN